MKPYLSSLLLSAGFSLLLVSCDSGTARKISSFDELPDPTADTLSDWSGVPRGLHASFVSTDAVFKRSVAPDVVPSASARLEGWRGERVSAQLLLWTASGADGVEVEVGTYFRGEATPEEEKQIMDWAESSPENYQEYLKERKIWNAILMYSVNPTIKATATHKRLFLSLYKYAAIAVIAFGVGFYTLHNRNVPGDFLSHLSPMDISEPVLLQNNQKYIALGAESFSLNEQKGIVKNNHTDKLLSYHQEDASRGFSFGKKRADNRLLVPQGQTYKLALADGTNVMLNAESELTFPSEFDTDRREVFLKGEAFFQVTHNEKAPFIVHTDQLDVQVLGTTFNVSGYNNENMLKVTLVEGSIQIGRAHV